MTEKEMIEKLNWEVHVLRTMHNGELCTTRYFFMKNCAKKIRPDSGLRQLTFAPDWVINYEHVLNLFHSAFYNFWPKTKMEHIPAQGDFTIGSDDTIIWEK